ncbi:hypothetical protein EXIGLDRAFT_768270 [Exidia glandulosa HHB12029]|uniref:AA9 family lytic polysaccharide monooxygenase n=1 Tax=Exidia glandulosa HHB12029 TaxID=1314781 RepID=A0A165IDM0_EXIGL|nr:hypothetical protein EXIGLDRAFT_768270 [Exidia glandulosa HHB12029]
MLFRAGVLAASFVASVSAHATFQQLWINNVDFGGSCVRTPQSNNPVASVTTNDIICNASPSAAANTCAVKAGDTLTVEMHQQAGDRSCVNEAIGGAHYGPVIVYMAPVANASTALATGQKWFKVAEAGLPSSSPDYWATQVLNDNCGHFTFKLPSDIPSGDYLLRAEVIALHVASQPGGAQFYMSCYQISVSGGGSATPSPMVAFPGAYSASDPGILINIYTQLNSYTIPGPAPFATVSPTVATTPFPTTATMNTATLPKTGFTTLPGAAAPTSAPVPTGSPSSPAQPITPVTPTGTASAPAATQTKFGQCGGQGFTGPTTCAAGSTCKASSVYYSQCL